MVDPHPGTRVAGVLFEITSDQMAAMDREEFDAARDTAGTGRRISKTVQTEDGPVRAELYTVEDDGRRHAPPKLQILIRITGEVRESADDGNAEERMIRIQILEQIQHLQILEAVA